jgi:hypothetical protein
MYISLTALYLSFEAGTLLPPLTFGCFSPYVVPSEFDTNQSLRTALNRFLSLLTVIY